LGFVCKESFWSAFASARNLDFYVRESRPQFWAGDYSGCLFAIVTSFRDDFIVNGSGRLLQVAEYVLSWLVKVCFGFAIVLANKGFWLLRKFRVCAIICRNIGSRVIFFRDGFSFRNCA
jgi:hypothetical protein